MTANECQTYNLDCSESDFTEHLLLDQHFSTTPDTVKEQGILHSKTKNHHLHVKTKLPRQQKIPAKNALNGKDPTTIP